MWETETFSYFLKVNSHRIFCYFFSKCCRGRIYTCRICSWSLNFKAGHWILQTTMSVLCSFHCSSYPRYCRPILQGPCSCLKSWPWQEGVAISEAQKRGMWYSSLLEPDLTLILGLWSLGFILNLRHLWLLDFFLTFTTAAVTKKVNHVSELDDLTSCSTGTFFFLISPFRKINKWFMILFRKNEWVAILC